MGGEGEKHKKFSWIDGHDIKPPLASSFYYTPSVVPPSSFFPPALLAAQQPPTPQPLLPLPRKQSWRRGGGNLPSKAWKDGKIEGGGEKQSTFLHEDRQVSTICKSKSCQRNSTLTKYFDGREKNHTRTLDSTSNSVRGHYD